MIKQQGKKAQEWLRVRREWVRKNPPDHYGYYLCGICGKPVKATEMELDHIQARSHAPQSSSDLSNLQPSHGWPCNRGKGSRTVSPIVSHAEYELRRLLDL